MNRKDAIIQAHFPTVMVPKHEPLSECETGRTRLLMAEHGLYVETRQTWGELVLPLWVSPRPLPYGGVEEKDTFWDALVKSFCAFEWEIAEAAARYAERGLEWAGWVVHCDGRFDFRELEQESVSMAHVSVKYPKLAEGESLVLDVHSHGRMKPFFSSTDDEDDRGGVKICAVMGGYESGFRVAFRYAVEGFFFHKGERYVRWTR